MDGRWSPVRPSGSAGNLATAAISIWSSRAARRIAASRPLPAAGRFGRVGWPDLADRAIFLVYHRTTRKPFQSNFGERAHPWLASIQQRPRIPRLCYREIAPNLLNGHSVPLATSCMALSTPAFNSCRCVESGEPPRLFGVEPPRANRGGADHRHDPILHGRRDRAPLCRPPRSARGDARDSRTGHVFRVVKWLTEQTAGPPSRRWLTQTR